MTRQIRDVELFGVTESSFTLSFDLREGDEAIDSEARIIVGGERHLVPATHGTRLVRIEGLPADTALPVTIEAPGAEPAPPDAFFEGSVTTSPVPKAIR